METTVDVKHIFPERITVLDQNLISFTKSLGRERYSSRFLQPERTAFHSGHSPLSLPSLVTCDVHLQHDCGEVQPKYSCA